ncbi:hypothetical protein [Acidicapsa acidisoli]|uniref:hypothetical protein n=1 Tax=Acidicapsa acidisoli TaxID=1615681 RepID=UPI0021DFCE5F|nr:hypothetical protein [Acidicapsa acidisoli]
MTVKSIGGNSRIEALRKREAALREAIAMEKVRQQKKDEKDDARLHLIIGGALVRNAAQHSDYELMLKSVLTSMTTFTDGEKKLLRAKGWL